MSMNERRTPNVEVRTEREHSVTSDSERNPEFKYLPQKTSQPPKKLFISIHFFFPLGHFVVVMYLPLRTTILIFPL